MKKQKLSNIKIIDITMPEIGIVTLRPSKGVKIISANFDIKKQEVIIIQDKKSEKKT